MSKEGYIYPRGFASKFRVWCANLQVVPTGAGTRIQMGSGIIFDILNEFNAALYQFTPNQAGYYFFNASLAFTNLNIGDDFYIRIVRNAAFTHIGNKTQMLVGWEPARVSGFLYVTPNDTIWIEGWHNFGANRNIVNGAVVTAFEGFRVA